MKVENSYWCYSCYAIEFKFKGKNIFFMGFVNKLEIFKLSDW